MNPTEPVLAEVHRCRAIFDRLESHLTQLAVPDALTCAQVAHDITGLSVKVLRHLKKSP